MTRRLITYFDYKSPYTYVAKPLIERLALDCRIELDWRPYTIRIPDALGSAEVNERGERLVDMRNDHQWRRVKYMYMDCRRLARQRSLPFHAPRRVYDGYIAHVGALFARKRGKFSAYHTAVFDRFWASRFDLDSPVELDALMRSVGIDTGEFASFVEGEGGAEHARLMEEAHRMGVFGAPSFILDGELYWGGEHLPALREKLSSPNRL